MQPTSKTMIPVKSPAPNFVSQDSTLKDRDLSARPPAGVDEEPV